MNMNMVCATCHGTKFVGRPEVEMRCFDCGDTSVLFINDADLAKMKDALGSAEKT